MVFNDYFVKIPIQFSSSFSTVQDISASSRTSFLSKSGLTQQVSDVIQRLYHEGSLPCTYIRPLAPPLPKLQYLSTAAVYCKPTKNFRIRASVMVHLCYLIKGEAFA